MDDRCSGVGLKDKAAKQTLRNWSEEAFVEERLYKQLSKNFEYVQNLDIVIVISELVLKLRLSHRLYNIQKCQKNGINVIMECSHSGSKVGWEYKQISQRQ